MTFRRWKPVRFRDLRLSSKLIVTYLLLTVLPMSLLGIVSYSQFAKSVRDEVGAYMPKFLHQVNADIEHRLTALGQLPDSLLHSAQIAAILRADDALSRPDLDRDRYAMNQYLAGTYVNGNNPDVLGVYVLSGENLFHSARWVFKEKDWSWQLRRYSGQEPNPGQVRIILPDEIRLQFANEIPFIMLKKQIWDTENRRLLGSMFIAVDLAFIDRMLRELESDGRGQLWLMNEAGKIIYHTDPQRIGLIDEERRSYPLLSGSFHTTGPGEERLISVNESPRGLVLAHSIPVSELTGGVDFVRNVTVLVFLGIVLVTTVLSVVLSLNFTRPLKRLSGMMKNVEMGNFRVDYNLQSRDEIGSLARSLNSMIETIRELIQTNYQIEIRQKEAQLYALQSQINPHFMYNTLETIGMAVEEGEKETVVDMVTLLGRMLRFSVNNLSRSVTVAEEVQHVRDYLTIQKFRFEDRLTFDITVNLEEWQVPNLYTPKFILQPIVENAIKHGLENRRRLEIHISASREFGAQSGREDIVFRIRDNGPGIAAERLHELELSLRNELFQHKSSQFGLSNVNARIVMMHGAEYGLQLHSIEELGTEVVVRIPVMMKPQENEQDAENETGAG